MIFFYLVLMIMCLFDFRSSCFSLIFHFRAGFFFVMDVQLSVQRIETDL